MYVSKDEVGVRDMGLQWAVPAEELRARSRHTWPDVRGWLIYGRRKEAVPSYLGSVEPPAPGVTGICCSGGGIRSAAFNLGALQALHRRGAVHEARYIAAVSGGSYIAAAVAMVAQTWPGGPGAPRPEPGRHGRDDSDPELVTDARPPFHRGSREEQYLRNRSSYLAPGVEGKLFLGYRVLLGMAWNIGFMVLFLVAMGSALALYYRGAYPDLTGHRPMAHATTQACSPLDVPGTCRYAAHVPGYWQTTMLALGGGSLAAGLVALLAPIHRDHVRRAFEAWSVRLLIGLAGVAILFALLPLLVAVARNYNWSRTGQGSFPVSLNSPLGTTSGASVATLLAAALAHIRSRVTEPAQVLQTAGRGRRFVLGLGHRSRLALGYVAVGIAGPVLTLVTVVAVMSKTMASDQALLWPPVVAGAAFIALYLAADLTSWSLHPFYKRRLCTAFALKRVGTLANPVAVERDYDALVPLSQTAVDIGGHPWPTLLVCAAANVSDPGATPPGRGVTSFTFSAATIGGPLVGAISTRTLEGDIHHSRHRAFTLPAAVAMSGAALSPSMGKMTRRPFTFLMALLNIRLGVWVPNPRRVDAWRKRHPLRCRLERLGLPGGHIPDHLLTWLPGVDDALLTTLRGRRKLLNPRPHPSYLLRELLGLNRLNAKYLYVTDGGHYENLGLVELLRRGCTDIYCFDASGGDSFSQLGDAVALARSELGVEIDIDPTPMVPAGERRLAEADCVRGRIAYADGTPGRLVYARTVMTEHAPWDVHAYHDADTTFPHHPTADQLYTDQKFEAYRALGETAGVHAHALLHARRQSRDGEALTMVGVGISRRPD